MLLTSSVIEKNHSNKTNHHQNNSIETMNVIKFSSTIKNRVVRDLIWAISSPSILSTQYLGDFDKDDFFTNSVLEHRSSILQLDQNPQKLEAFLSNRQTGRLGETFEKLWQFWLQEIMGYELIVDNFQIFTNDRTLGAFDLLARKKDSEDLMHFEFTSKFYLNNGQGVRRSDWKGPDSKDRLDKKTNRMFDHQLQLSNYPATETVLQQKNWHIDQKIGIFRGRLFWHISEELTTVPYWMNEQVLTGFWCRAEELSQQVSFSRNSWVILNKQNWLSPLIAADTSIMKGMSIIEIAELSKEQERPFQIARLNTQSEEFERGFVIPDHVDWPSK